MKLEFNYYSGWVGCGVWVVGQNKSNTKLRDGILRERREHARGRILADCGRICGSPRKSVGSN